MKSVFALIFAMLITTVTVSAQSNDWEKKLFEAFNAKRTELGLKPVTFNTRNRQITDSLSEITLDYVFSARPNWAQTPEVKYRPDYILNTRNTGYMEIVGETEDTITARAYAYAKTDVMKVLDYNAKIKDIKNVSILFKFMEYTESDGESITYVYFDIMFEKEKLSEQHYQTMKRISDAKRAQREGSSTGTKSMLKEMGQ